ncbi:hypothetical protein A0257_14105 [Hymenobacter psoromatis]|nr:hypothetical protein A0257_14105 [Hymenobacter psoromatis]
MRDLATGENLIGVAVVQAGTGLGTATNTYGFYSLTVPTAGLDSVRLEARYLGYERGRWAAPATGSAQHTFRLPAATNELAGVEVVGDRQAADERGPRSTRMGTINVPIAQIKSLPKFMGETDVLKVLQLLPGVQSGGEGSSGLYVRGGSPDQNLILLDGTPVYNAAHLFGFFSVFNADALNNVELIKGGFPARYGGRLSSVLDISMKEGNMQALHGEGAISLVASRLTLEGPIKKDVASFIVSARRTYIDVLARPLIQAQLKNENQAGSLGYYFYDLNAKLNWKVSPRDWLYLSAYRGYDNFAPTRPMKTALLLLALAALAGCESVVTVTPPAYTPRLALTYTLSNQAPTAGYQQYFSERSAFASTSQAILVNKNFAGRTDATIELRDADGQIVEEFRPDTSRFARQPTYDRYGSYIPVRNYVGVPGQAYLLRASAPGVEAVEATMTLPSLPAVEAVSYVPLPPPANNNFFSTPYYGQLSFAIPDPAATTDYYVAYARTLDAAGRPWGYAFEDESLRSKDGPTINLNRFALSSTSNTNAVMPVSDAGRQGQRLLYSSAIWLYYGGGYASNQPAPPPPAYLELTVSSVPASTYDFYQSV